MEPVQGEPWPFNRAGHAACCLNYGKEGPQVLISGGVSRFNSIYKDMWLLDVNSGKWKQV